MSNGSGGGGEGKRNRQCHPVKRGTRGGGFRDRGTDGGKMNNKRKRKKGGDPRFNIF